MQASHVAMSAGKMMARVVASDRNEASFETASVIQCDPLAQFAVVFSSVIHDVDHTGVPNAQLVLEQTDSARHYNNQRYESCETKKLLHLES